MAKGRPEEPGVIPVTPWGYVEETGRTVDEAVERALTVLNMNRRDVDVEVLDEGSRGVLGIGAREARVRVRPRSVADTAGVVRAVAAELLGLMGFAAAITVAEGPESVRADVEGENLGVLIGKHGQTLAALEALLALVAGRRVGAHVRIELDVMGYRQRRRTALEALALRTADRVARTGREVALTPMDARDRRIIHLALREHQAATTASQGEGDLRRVVVMPRNGSEVVQESQEDPGIRRRSSRERRQTSGDAANQRSKAGGTSQERPDRARNPNYKGRWTTESRSWRFQERFYPAVGGDRGPGRKPANPGTQAGSGGRPEGLPVDEELEAEIQAHLDKVDRERTGDRPKSDSPSVTPESGESRRHKRSPEEE